MGLSTPSRSGAVLPCRSLAAPLLLLAASCTLAETVDSLERDSPPPELGRPALVRICARTGAWVGGFVGAVASVVLLPVTYPLSLLADNPLGYSQNEFRFAPVSMGAATGHWLLGAPPDVLHFVLYRAWFGETGSPASYDFVPMQPPADPGAVAPAGADR